jgi:hypothetical protein
VDVLILTERHPVGSAKLDQAVVRSVRTCAASRRRLFVVA